MKSITLTIFIMISTNAFAGQATIPNTFVSGTPAIAAEVNANFTSVKTAVDDNDVRVITNTTAISALTQVMPTTTYQVVDTNGTVLGDLISKTKGALTFASPQGYFVNYASGATLFGMYLDGMLWYTTFDCTGNYYKKNESFPGVVFNAGPSNALGDYYILKTAVSQQITTNSFFDVVTSACTVQTNSGPYYSQLNFAAINDPAVTGIPNHTTIGFPLSIQAK